MTASRPRTALKRPVYILIALALMVTLLWGAPPPPQAAADTQMVPATSFNIDGDIAGPNDWGDPLGSALYGHGTTPGGYPTTGIVTHSWATDECSGDASGYPGSQTIHTNP